MLNEDTLRALVVIEMEARGFITTGPHAWSGKMAEAIACAVVQHITEAAQVIVTGGSSAGTYRVI